MDKKKHNFNYLDTISLISRQGNKSFAKEIKLSNNDKIVAVIQKRKDIELVTLKFKITKSFFILFMVERKEFLEEYNC